MAAGNAQPQQHAQRNPSVGFYSSSTGWGGSETYLRDLLLDRRRRGCEDTLFCPARYRLLGEPGAALPGRIVHTTQDAPPPEATATGAEPTTTPRRMGFRHAVKRLVPHPARLLLGAGREARALARHFRRHRVELLHVNDTGCEVGPIAARHAGVPLVVGTLHALPGYRPHETDAAHRLIEQASVRSMDMAIAVSAFTKEAWLKRVGISPDRVRVIYNGLDIERFRPSRPPAAMRGELGLPADAPVIGVTARLHPMKGHRYLLEALPAVLARVPEARVVLTGDGPLRGELERLAESLRVEDRVRFLGHRADVADVTSIYDVAVLPSVMLETFGYSLTEAMALGKAAVGSRFSGIPEVIDEGRTGHLVAPEDPRALAEAIVDLLIDPDKRRTLGEAGRRRVAERFTLRRMLDETFALFEEILERRRKHG